MWPFDDTLNALNGIYAGLQEMIVALLLALAYPFVIAINIIENVINDVLVKVIELLNAFISLPNAIIDLTNVLFVGVFPSAWITLLGLSLLLAIGLRLYSFAKDVSIVGFKI